MRLTMIIAALLLCGWSVRAEAQATNPILRGAQRQIGVVAWDTDMAAKRPPGKGVCVDVILDAFLDAGIDLADSIMSDVRQHPSAYAFAVGDAIDTRRARVQIDWFRRHAEELPTDSDFQPGDIVFYTGTHLEGGVADHVAIVSDSTSRLGMPYIIDNFPSPGYVSCTRLVTFAPYTTVRIIGHFRYPSR